MIDDILLAPGTVVGGRYTIERPLGAGSFGRTYLVQDAERHSLIALKFFNPQSARDLKAQELFQREGSVLRSLRHHGVPEVFETGTIDIRGREMPVLTMEFIEGPSLAALIQQQHRFSPGEVHRLFFDLLSVLEYLHECSPPVLHRDIKPANVILRANGFPVLVDFGSVRHVFLNAEESGSTVAGTYGYMPFEQYMGQASAASDLFSLAATFLHLVTGRPPKEFMDEHGRIVLPAQLPVPAALRSVLARLLSASPAERFSSARETREALFQAVDPVAVAATNSRSVAKPAPKGRVAAELLEPIPRPMDDSRKQLLNRLAPSVYEYMDTTAKATDKAGIFDWLILAGASVMTLGIYPAVFIGFARARRRRLRKFIQEGMPAMARIHRIDSEEIAFAQRIARVHYEFEVDGVRHRDSDQVLPLASGRMELNDYIEILYIPDDNFDSVIVEGV